MRSIFKFLILIVLALTTKEMMAQEKTTRILVLIHSDQGGTYELAKEVAKGIESRDGVRAIIKKVAVSENPKLKDLPLANVEELPTYDGIAFGSPIYFGNISTAMSEFLSKTVKIWSSHGLEGMPATVFMSAGSGAGRDLALQSFYNSLAVHGMVLVPNGIKGDETIDKSIPQGNSVLGTTSLVSLKGVDRPSASERQLAALQGSNFAKVAQALRGTFSKGTSVEDKKVGSVNKVLKDKNIVLPNVPKPAGNYEPYVRSGNLVFINQVALKGGALLYAGKLDRELTEQQVKEATRLTMLNIIAVLAQAVDGDLDKVKRCVQLTGIFNTKDDYTKHAALMNVASDLAVEIFGEKGKHARATFGASSIPLNSPVEIQAVFEIE